MVLKNKNILLISPESWEHIFVSKHHYAIYLGAQGNIVFFLNPQNKQPKINNTGYNNVWSLNYRGFPKGLRFYPTFLQRYFIRKKFEQLQKLCKVRFDIIWSFDNSVFYDFKALPKSVLKISHIVDLNQNFQTAKASNTADICIAVSHSILHRLRRYKKNAFFINHGFNDFNVIEEAQVIPGSNNKKVALIGNLAMPYLDWKIILEATKNNTDVDFVFYGPQAKEFSKKINTHHQYKEELSTLANTFFLGKVEANIIPSILKEVDVVLVSYQEAYHVDQSNPHKMMEYLGSGKVVVATKTMEYNSLAKQGIIAMVENNADFQKLFKKVVDNLADWNNPKKQRQRKAFALDNTYVRQIERIEEFINEKAQ